jgi:hypothetical protein
MTTTSPSCASNCKGGGDRFRGGHARRAELQGQAGACASRSGAAVDPLPGGALVLAWSSPAGMACVLVGFMDARVWCYLEVDCPLVHMPQEEYDD